MFVVYGVLNKDNVHIDTSKTLLGAKMYATRNGYINVSKRAGYNVHHLAQKQGKKWVCTEFGKL